MSIQDRRRTAHGEQTGADTTNYAYDQNGNLTLIDAAGALTTQTWDTENRLVRVENPDGSVEQMGYGADGLRRSKRVTPAGGPASETIFVYDGQNLLQERNASGLILANYTWSPEHWNVNAGQGWEAGSIGNVVLLQRCASTPGDLAGGTSSYFGPDFSSNVRILFDSNGTPTDRMVYEAFGELFSRSGSTATPFLFGGSVGYYTDAQRRLNVGWRVYDPVVGRWTSLDPIGFDGGLWNLYGYVGNNPIDLTDPSGLFLSMDNPGAYDKELTRQVEKGLDDIYKGAMNCITRDCSRSECESTAALARKLGLVAGYAFCASVMTQPPKSMPK